MGYFPEPWCLALLPRLGGSNGLALPLRGKTYTFSPQDVYVLLAKRIRFVPIRLYVVGKAESRRAVERGE